MVVERFDRALRAQGIPIAGVSARDDADRGTWRIDYLPSATPQQRSAGDALRLTFDPLDQTAIDAETTDKATATSRQKDVLAMCALVVRSRGVAIWNAMTMPQRVAAVNAEADVWAQIRVFIDKNL
jgi:hypothetical protein